MSFFGFVTNAGDGTVSTFRIGDDGGLERVAVTPVGPGCGTLAVDPARRVVHVAVKGAPPRVVTCRVLADGSLRTLSSRGAPDALQYLALTPDGSRLLAASYGGGFGLVWPLRGQATARIEYPNLHSVAEVNGDVYFVSLGADLVAQYRLVAGALLPLDPPAVAFPEGSGPRHIVFSADRRHAYVMTEFTGRVHHLRRAQDGGLTLAGSVSAVDPSKGLRVSRFGADPKTEPLIWGADLHLSRDGRTLWASERGGSTLAVIPVRGDGTLGSATGFVDTEPQPRGFAVTPDGRHLLVTGERSTHVSLYAVGDGGALTRGAREETGRGANWVRFLPAD